MPRRSIVTRDHWIAAAEANPGSTAKQLAEIVGATPHAARLAHSRYDLGLVREQAGSRTLGSRRNLVADYAERGYSSAEIAEAIGCEVDEARDARSYMRKVGRLTPPSWETLHARGWDANTARKLRGAPAGEAYAWAEANGVEWPKEKRRGAEPKGECKPWPKPSFAGDGPLIRWRIFDRSREEAPHPWKVYADAKNRAMRAACGLRTAAQS